MKKISITLLVMMTLLLSAVLTACQGAPAAASEPTASGQATAALDAAAPNATAVLPSATAQPSPTQAPEPTATATPLSATDNAEAAAQAYFGLLEDGKMDEASDSLSAFSLMVFNLTRGEAASQLKQEKASGVKWSDLAVLDSSSFDEQTILVHVTYNYQQKDETTARDEMWPFRLENGAWRYNLDNLIDYHTLDADPQTMNGITVMPTQILRYSDRIDLMMLIQNRTNDVVVFGQANEILGTFHFGDNEIGAEHIQLILNPLRSVPDVTLTAKGLYQDYPDSIEIRKWKSYNVAPWYVFDLQ